MKSIRKRIRKYEAKISRLKREIWRADKQQKPLLFLTKKTFNDLKSEDEAFMAKLEETTTLYMLTEYIFEGYEGALLEMEETIQDYETNAENDEAVIQELRDENSILKASEASLTTELEYYKKLVQGKQSEKARKFIVKSDDSDIRILSVKRPKDKEPVDKHKRKISVKLR